MCVGLQRSFLLPNRVSVSLQRSRDLSPWRWFRCLRTPLIQLPFIKKMSRLVDPFQFFFPPGDPPPNNAPGCGVLQCGHPLCTRRDRRLRCFRAAASFPQGEMRLQFMLTRFFFRFFKPTPPPDWQSEHVNRRPCCMELLPP